MTMLGGTANVRNNATFPSGCFCFVLVHMIRSHENNLDEVTSEDVCGELDVTVVHDDYKSNSESIDALPVERTSWKRRTCFSSDLEKIEDIADESQRYALQKGVNFEVYVQDIMQFFGLILLRGNLLVPNENYFWKMINTFAKTRSTAWIIDGWVLVRQLLLCCMTSQKKESYVFYA
ncbi:PiggyBac transposable element-derived protein [Trichinella pseudospiralis]